MTADSPTLLHYNVNLVTPCNVTIRKERTNLGVNYYVIFFFQGSTPEKLLPSLHQLHLFNELKTAVTKDLLHKIAAEERPRERDSGMKAKGSHAKAAMNTFDEGEMLENRFACLYNLEEQDSQDDDK